MNRPTALLLLLAPFSVLAASAEFATTTESVASPAAADPMETVTPGDLPTTVNPIAYAATFTDTQIGACVNVSVQFRKATKAIPDDLHKCQCLLSVFSNRGTTQMEYDKFRSKKALTSAELSKLKTMYKASIKECKLGKFPTTTLFPKLTSLQ